MVCSCNNFKIAFVLRDIVRKKAVMAIQSFYSKNPSAIPDVKERAKNAVRDKDPGVLSAALHVFHELIKVIRPEK